VIGGKPAIDCIVSIHLYSASCSAQQSEVLPVREKRAVDIYCLHKTLVNGFWFYFSLFLPTIILFVSLVSRILLLYPMWITLVFYGVFLLHTFKAKV